MSEPPPLDLRGTQELFWRAIAWPTGVRDFLDRADEATRQAFAHTFVSAGDLDAVGRMEIYANAYFWRLHEVLAEQFSVAAEHLGEVAFHNRTTDYVLRCPSRDPDLRRFGARFPAFLAAVAASAGDGPHVAAFARAQWAMMEVLDAPDEVALTPEDVTTPDPVQLLARPLARLSASRLFRSAWDFRAAWERHKRGEPPEPPDPTEGYNLVWRAGLRVWVRRLDPAEGRALAVLTTRGASFGALCEAARRGGATMEQVARWLRRWLDDGLLREPPAQEP